MSSSTSQISTRNCHPLGHRLGERRHPVPAESPNTPRPTHAAEVGRSGSSGCVRYQPVSLKRGVADGAGTARCPRWNRGEAKRPTIDLRGIRRQCTCIEAEMRGAGPIARSLSMVPLSLRGRVRVGAFPGYSCSRVGGSRVSPSPRPLPSRERENQKFPGASPGGRVRRQFAAALASQSVGQGHRQNRLPPRP